MSVRNIKIVGTGKYLPKNTVTAAELDRRLGVREGWVAKKTGVLIRHYADTETASWMGAQAAFLALKDSGLTYEDIDCIVCASGTAQQAIPCTAALIQKEMGKEESGTPCFDINSTCLSFVVGLDVMSYMVDAGRYSRVLFVSTEVASVGLNWEQKESCALFGDGACAVIIERSQPSDASKIRSARLETYSKGAHLSEIRGGGSKLHPREYRQETQKDFLFDMDGKAIFRMASKLIGAFTEHLLSSSGCSISDIDFVIPHQASGMSMRILREKLGIPKEKFVDIIENHGNTIAASIPMALHELLKQKSVKRGDKLMLIGTAAGLSLGGVVLEY